MLQIWKMGCDLPVVNYWTALTIKTVVESKQDQRHRSRPIDFVNLFTGAWLSDGNKLGRVGGNQSQAGQDLCCGGACTSWKTPLLEDWHLMSSSVHSMN